MEISNKTFDEERALYGIRDALVDNCKFVGPADGESALKETSDIRVKDCFFALRYPFWHTTNAQVDNIDMTETCRAALWYDNNIRVSDSRLHGIKALRECANVELVNDDIVSAEFGWKCSNIKLKNVRLVSEYPFLMSRDFEAEGLTMTGKYSFQYVENAVIRNSVLNTKDAFWHTKNVTVIDSVIKGEYLAWYSENLRLIRCKLIGTQPLCYCKGLVLEDCTMEGCDLSFERSEVTATVNGHIDSVKNPIHGSVVADSIGEIISELESDCAVTTR